MAPGIEGVGIEISPEAIVVTAATPLRTLASAVVGGGHGEARSIVNLHVEKAFECRQSAPALAEFARRRRLPAPWVGLFTAAATGTAEVVVERADGIVVAAVVTVGLSNPSAAGRSAAAAPRPSTINTIVVVDAAPDPAALVNLVMTATEAKALALAEARVRTADGLVASGTSTDAVVVAATGRGVPCSFGGPVSDLGWLAGRAARRALEAGIRRWLLEHA